MKLQFDALLKEPVDAFNRAVDELDEAMGMDATYERYGPNGAGLYPRDQNCIS